MNKLVFDYSKLNGLIVEKFKTQVLFAKAMGISKSTMSLKMTNKSAFTQEEIYDACLLLNINQKEISSYFFTPKVK